MQNTPWIFKTYNFFNYKVKINETTESSRDFGQSKEMNIKIKLSLIYMIVKSF